MSELGALHTQLLELDWLEPWALLSAARAAQAERVLTAALTPAHPFSGRALRAVAARVDCDDVLFWVDAPEALVVQRLPPDKAARLDAAASMIFASVQEFIEACLQPDHLEYTDRDEEEGDGDGDEDDD